MKNKNHNLIIVAGKIINSLTLVGILKTYTKIQKVLVGMHLQKKQSKEKTLDLI
jgi:hypothetical protein